MFSTVKAVTFRYTLATIPRTCTICTQQKARTMAGTDSILHWGSPHTGGFYLPSRWGKV